MGLGTSSSAKEPSPGNAEEEVTRQEASSDANTQTRFVKKKRPKAVNSKPQDDVLGALLTGIVPSVGTGGDFSGLQYSPDGVCLLKIAHDAFLPANPLALGLVAKNEVGAVLRTLFCDLDVRSPLLVPRNSARLAAIVKRTLDSITDEEAVNFCDFLKLLSMSPWFDALPAGRFDLHLHAHEQTPRMALEDFLWTEFATPAMPALCDVDADGLKQYWTEMFRIADKNGDGQLSTQEFIGLLETSGFELTESEIWNILRRADKNKDGALQYEEFMPAMIETMKMSTQPRAQACTLEPSALMAYLHQLFLIADENGDGVLQPRELARLLEMSGLGFSRKQVKRLCSTADTNNDGVVDMKEFISAAVQILKPKRDVAQCIELLWELYHWLEVLYPAILEDESQVEQWIVQHCVELGYPQRLGSALKLDYFEFLSMIAQEPWRRSLRCGMLEEPVRKQDEPFFPEFHEFVAFCV